MIDQALALVPTLGPWFLGLIVALGCLGVPLPSTLSLLMAGALTATGELALLPVLGAAFAGAVAGDQAGYALGRLASGTVRRALGGNPARARIWERTQAMVVRRGGMAVFLTRWLITPLCPVANLVSGAGALGWWRFTLWDAAGEAVWVGLYVGLGHWASADAAALLNLASEAMWLVLALLLAAGLTWRLVVKLRQGPA